MKSSANCHLLNWGRTVLIALFAATAMLIGGAEALAPAPAVAVMQDPGCTEPDVWTFLDCEEENGGGGSGSGGGSTGGQTQGDDGSSGTDTQPVELPGETIEVKDTKPLEEPCTPRPGYLDCIPAPNGCKPGYICLPPGCDFDHIEDCHNLPKLISKAFTRASDCPLSLGKAMLMRCLNRLKHDQCKRFAPGSTREECRQMELGKLVRHLSRCKELQAELDSLRTFRGHGRGYSDKAWNALGYDRKEKRLEEAWEAAQCDAMGPEL